jgi:hypothetical protein
MEYTFARNNLASMLSAQTMQAGYWPAEAGKVTKEGYGCANADDGSTIL